MWSPDIATRIPLEGMSQSNKRSDKSQSERSSLSGAMDRTATLYSVRSAVDLDHEAVIRFECESPRRRAHSSLGVSATAFLVSPPPRILTDDVRACGRRLTSVGPAGHRLPQAARRTRPSGTAPVVTSRQKAI